MQLMALRAAVDEGAVIQTDAMRIALTGLLLFPLVGCSRLDESEHPESHYESYLAAVESDALGKGRFIPDLLPESAFDIYETHDLDSNEAWVAFRYAPGDSCGVRGR